MDTTAHDTTAATAIGRRPLLGGAAAAALGVPLLAACGGSTSSTASSAAAAAGSAGSALASAAGSAGSALASAASGLIKAADVPVGGGTIIEAAKIVVTQPTAGTYKVLSAVCTHQGCIVSSVENASIVCKCHGSTFSLNGDVTNGPATQPLAAKAATVTDGMVVASA